MQKKHFRSIQKSLGLALLSLTASVSWAYGSSDTENSLAGYLPINPSELIFMKVNNHDVIFLLSPDFAPQFVDQFKRLANTGFYDGLPWYRVVNGFVTQGGVGEYDPIPEYFLPLESEIEIPASFSYTSVEENDPFADETGFYQGLPIGLSKSTNKAWIPHCPGVLGVSRYDDPDSGWTDIYAVTGQAPRYLDRSLTMFGRVIYGLEHLQAVNRGDSDPMGVFKDFKEATTMESVRSGDMIPESDRLQVFIEDTSSDSFKEKLQSRKHRETGFLLYEPPAYLDVCQIPVDVIVQKPQ